MEEKLEKGELIVAEIVEIHANSIYLKLVDSGKKGFLNVSNIPGLWIRDLKKSMKKGQLIVGKIIGIDHFVELSLKGVSKYEKERKLKEFSLEKKAVKMFERVCEENKVPKKLVEKETERLKEEFGGVHKALERIRKGEDIGADEKFGNVCARFGTGTKTYEFKGELELHSNSGNGLEIIRNSLSEIHNNVDASYLGNTKFLLKFKTSNPKKGEKTLTDEAEKAISKIKKSGGHGEFKLVD